MASTCPSIGTSPGSFQTSIIGLAPSNGTSSASGSTPVAIQTPQATPGGGGPQKRTPFHWLASQYPSKKMWVEEMPLLERVLNGENKEQVRKHTHKTEYSTDNKHLMQLFNQKKTKDGKSIAIHNEKMMEELAKGRYEDLTKKIKDVPSDQALRVVRHVREMVGTLFTCKMRMSQRSLRKRRTGKGP
jgi:uncharacterized FlaG/YvyC family protein